MFRDKGSSGKVPLNMLRRGGYDVQTPVKGSVTKIGGVP